jgi:shikimate dehydrogenase
VTVAVPRACLMGHPVAHSRSPMIHGYWLAQLGIDGRYDLKDLAAEEFADFFTHLAENGYVGGNITVPYKEAAYRLVHRRDQVAEAVGAVNTVWLEGDMLMGGNSDTHGILASLDDSAPGWDVAAGRAVVLGAGGAARSAAYGLITRGMDVSLVNRTVHRAEELAAHFGFRVRGYGFDGLPPLLAAADLLVNCTSLGMVGKPPLVVGLGPLKRSAVVCDVVYVPLETPLLAECRARGHRTVDGLGMLLQQAGFGFEKWFGAMPKVEPKLRVLIEADIRAKTEIASPLRSK